MAPVRAVAGIWPQKEDFSMKRPNIKVAAPPSHRAPVPKNVEATPAPPVLAATRSVPISEQVLDLPALQKFFSDRGFRPFSRTRLFQLERDGMFPARVKLGSLRFSRTAWKLDEVTEWFREKMEAERPQNRWRPRCERREPKLEKTVQS